MHQPSYNSRCLHVMLVLNTTTVQGDTMSREGGTASNFHHSPCFAPISFLVSCKAAANRVYMTRFSCLAEQNSSVWPQSWSQLTSKLCKHSIIVRNTFPQKAAITTHCYRQCLTSQKSQWGDDLEGPIPLGRYNSPILSGDIYIYHEYAHTHKKGQTDCTVYLYRQWKRCLKGMACHPMMWPQYGADKAAGGINSSL